MKKKIVLFTLIAGMCYLGFSSYSSGPAANAFNCTGAKASVNNCGSVASGCHSGAGAATTATIRVDSAGGVSVNRYVAGMTYTVTVTGANTTLTHFGFQYAVVSGTGSGQVQAGSCSGLPSQVAAHSLVGLSFIEHTSAITGPLSKQFKWTAPSPSAGDVTMYLTVNAVNFNGSADAGDVSDSTLLVLHNIPPATSVVAVAENIAVKLFPNPVTNTLNLQLDSAPTGNYAVHVYDLNGKNIMNSEVTINSVAQLTSINTTGWTPGMYILTIEKDGNRQMTTFVKQ